LRGHPQWRELFPRLEELGIAVSVRHELPKVKEAFENYLRQMREARRTKMVKPTAGQRGVEKLFPALAPDWRCGAGLHASRSASGWCERRSWWFSFVEFDPLFVKPAWVACGGVG